MEVAVRHLQPGQHDADSLGLEARHLRATDRLRRLGEVTQQRRFEVDPVVDLAPRHDQAVARAKRTVGEENDALVIFPDESRGQPALDDLGEDRPQRDKPKWVG